MEMERAPSSASRAHPGSLVEIDRPYLVPWGRGEMLRLLARLLLLGAVVVGLALLHRHWIWLLLLVPLGLLLAVGVLFFRNPARRVPVEPGILVAPADGKVLEVGRVEESEYLGGPALRVCIFLSIFDVHVNRSPGAGRVEYLRYRPGKFHDARDERCALENESQSIGIGLEGDEPGAGDRVLIRQISGAIARRIVCPLAPGDSVARGGLIGMIKYGSRTELYVPAPPGTAVRRDRVPTRWEAAVRPGDRVRGGSSVLFRLKT